MAGGTSNGVKKPFILLQTTKLNGTNIVNDFELAEVCVVEHGDFCLPNPVGRSSRLIFTMTGGGGGL